jgi:hypothetical protein
MGMSMWIIKFKPKRIPRLFDLWSSQQVSDIEQRVKNSVAAVLRSKELIVQSWESVARAKQAIKQRDLKRAESPRIPSFMKHFFVISPAYHYSFKNQ